MCEDIYYDGFGCLNPNKIGIKLSSWKQISIINGFFESMKASKGIVDLHFSGAVVDLSFKLRRQHFDSTGPTHSILCGSLDTVVEKLEWYNAHGTNFTIQVRDDLGILEFNNCRSIDKIAIDGCFIGTLRPVTMSIGDPVIPGCAISPVLAFLMFMGFSPSDLVIGSNVVEMWSTPDSDS